MRHWLIIIDQALSWMAVSFDSMPLFELDFVTSFAIKRDRYNCYFYFIAALPFPTKHLRFYAAFYNDF